MSITLHRILQIVCLAVFSFLATAIAAQLFVLSLTSPLSVGIFAFLIVLSLWLSLASGGPGHLPTRELIAIGAFIAFSVAVSLWVKADPTLADDWSAKYFVGYMALIVLALIGLYHLTATPKRLGRFFALVGSLLLFYALLEVLAGIARPRIVAKSAGTNIRILQTDYINPGSNAPWREQIGWASPLNATIHYKLDGFYETSYVTNGRGYRGPVVPYEKSPDTFRILVTGDSFVEALRVNYEQTFHALLKKQVPNLEAKKVEVIGVGTSGYGTIHEYLYYKLEGYK